MRIIAGKFKGRRLKFPENKITRPTADMVKEAIFAKIFERIKEAVFLDAFCGSGQVGIEALSRGALKAYFIDEDFYATKIVKENIKSLGIENQSQVFATPILKALPKFKEAFDVIFLDPPYDYKDYKTFFEKVRELNLLNENGLIVCEHARDLVLEFEGFEKTSVKSYGIKSVSYFEFV